MSEKRSSFYITHYKYDLLLPINPEKLRVRIPSAAVSVAAPIPLSTAAGSTSVRVSERLAFIRHAAVCTAKE